LKKGLDKKTTRELLKEQLGWDSLDEFREGFWLNKYVFIKADGVQVVKVERQKLDGEQKSGPLPMVVLDGVVVMVVDKDRKILSVECKERFGFWLDALSKIVKSKNSQ
jgi:hypothetical protein